MTRKQPRTVRRAFSLLELMVVLVILGMMAGIVVFKTQSHLVHKMPRDPWGNAYQYNNPGRNGPYEVICYGADGREGGEGANMDISSDDGCAQK